MYDFSEIDGSDVDELGEFVCRNLDRYWKEPGRYPLLIYVDGKIAGFALVAYRSVVSRNTKARWIAEFFVMRKYRRRGIGKRVAFEVFNRYPGSWEVGQIPQNVPALKFWRRVIGEYTRDNYREIVLDNETWRGTVQIFDNSRQG